MLGLRIEAVILLAFGFGNLAMLGWLAAAAAPLLIHLWSRHRFRESPWAAMQFLLAAMRKNARRLQLQQWLLLAVRTLIILLVVLAAAEPYGQQSVAGGNAGPSHKVIVIDGSYSMAYHSNGSTNFATAKQLAIEMVSASHPGDAFTVILMASPPKLAAGAEVIDRARVTAQIESLALPQGGADLAQTLALVQEALNEKGAHNMPARKEVYFLTDLQARTWSGVVKKEQAADAKQSRIAAAITSIGERASIFAIDLGQPNASNLAVTNLSLSSAVVTVGREIGVNAVVHNFGQETHTKSRVEMLVDDVDVGEQAIDVAAGSESAIHFTHRFQTTGDHVVTIRTSGDRLELDNSRSLVVPVRGEVRVLCVAGREGAAKYVVSALNPNPSGDSPIRPIVVAEGDLADAQLADFDCVFLCNVAQLTAGEAGQLAEYAKSGGGIVIFLGDRVVPATYNALLQGGAGTDGQAPLLPAAVGPIVALPQFGLDPLDYRHPIVAPFRGRERAGLLTTPVNRHYRLDVPSGRAGVEIVAALPGGDPFIVTAPLGRGRTVLIATDGSLSSIDPTSGEPWTTWPTWPSFLPLVRELLAYATGGQQTKWQQLVGQPLSGAIGKPPSQSTGSGELKITRPDGRAASISTRSSPVGSEWTYTETDISGIYTLHGLPEGRTQQFAVNVDTAEGDLAKINPQQLPPEIKVQSTWQEDASGGSVASTHQSAWNINILWSALALLFAESFMAWQFGRGAI
jgi:Aerotolerance regulator N-terminal/von Willebrand factor type A domain/CARDB